MFYNSTNPKMPRMGRRIFALLFLLQAVIIHAQDLLPLKGKWSAGDAHDYIGIWKKSQRVGYLDGVGDGDINGVTASLGATGDIPLSIDFTGDAREELVLYRPSTRELFFYADYTSAVATYTRTVGDPGDIIITGDWDGNGKDGFATYKPGSRSIWYFQNYNSPNPFASIVTGNPGDIPIAGDWDGDGDDSYGLYMPSSRDIWLFEGYDDTSPNQHMTLGDPGDTPIAGDWNGNGSDGVGVFRRTGTTNNYQFWLYDVIDAAPTRSIFLTDQSNFTYTVNEGRKVFYTQGVPHTDFDGNQITTYSPTQSFIPKGIYNPTAADLATVYQANYNLALMWPNEYPLDAAAKSTLDATTNKLRTIQHFVKPGGRPFTGRFSGGRDLPGISSLDGSRLLFFDSDGNGSPDRQMKTGDGGDYFFSGDWDGDGTDEFAAYKPGLRQIVYFQNIANPQAFQTITTGNEGDIPLSGNWDGLSGDGYALYRPADRQIWYFQAYGDTSPFAMVTQGNHGDIIIIGDWDGDGADGYACYNPPSRQVSFFQNYNSTQPFQIQVVGNPGDLPIAGDWDGDGTDGFGIYRTNAQRTYHEFWFYDHVSSTSTGVSTITFQNPLLETPRKYIYGFYTFDEPTQEPRQDHLDYLTPLYPAYAQLTPQVFFHVDVPYEHNNPGSIQNQWWALFNKLGEASAHDDYPVKSPNSQITTLISVATTIELAKSGNNDTLPTWYVPQTFQDLSGTDHKFYKPTAAQYRGMVYTALVHGATGFINFAYDNSAFPTTEGISPSRNTDLWIEASQFNIQLDSLRPYILSPTSTNTSYYIYTKASPLHGPSPIRCVLKYYNGYYVLIAVNMTSQSLNTIIQLSASLAPTSGRAWRMFEGPTTVKAGGISDTFAAFGVHVYKFKAPSSGSSGGREAAPVAAEEARVLPEPGPQIKVFPNPSRTGVTFQINTKKQSHVTVQIIDLQGRPVRTIEEHVTTSEVTTLTWDGLDAHHKRTSAGLYYYTLYSEGKPINRGKLVIE
jgi:hypothetical protein